jgi:hypothetical protein
MINLIVNDISGLSDNAGGSAEIRTSQMYTKFIVSNVRPDTKNKSIVY